MQESRRIRIATLYRKDLFTDDTPCCTMASVRWLRISEALACLGYDVDMISDGPDPVAVGGRRVRMVPHEAFDWRRYDVIKTLFHRGFETLAAASGAEHPFIISKLGSVVGDRDGVEGIHFFGAERAALYETQKRISAASRYVSVLTEPSRLLWESCFGRKTPTLMVPTAVDATIPPPGENPYRDFSEKIAVYIGNLYSESQREVNLIWQDRLHRLGRLLRRRGIRLCVIGPGRHDKLDSACATCLGKVANARVWDYQYFAHVGIVLAQGPAQHNESSKIYYYLRSGLPVVSESAVPNNFLLKETNLGFIANYGDEEQMAELVELAVHSKWEKAEAVRHILRSHTWTQRAEIYDRLIREALT